MAIRAPDGANKLGLTTMFSDFNSAEIRSDSSKFVGHSLKSDELGGIT